MHDYTLQVPEIMSVVQEQFSVGLQNPYLSDQSMEGCDVPNYYCLWSHFPLDQSCSSHTLSSKPIHLLCCKKDEIIIESRDIKMKENFQVSANLGTCLCYSGLVLTCCFSGFAHVGTMPEVQNDMIRPDLNVLHTF